MVAIVLIPFKLFASGGASKILDNEPFSVPEEVEIFDLQGNKHYLEEYEGKTVLLVFWATWCSPCVSEMKDLDILQKDFRKLPFLVLPISEDYTGVKGVEAFYTGHNLRHLPILHDYKNKLFRAMNITGLPTSILINASGKAVVTFTGAIDWYDEMIREKILAHIEGNPTLPKNSYKDKSLNNLVIDQPQDIVQKEKNKNGRDTEDSGMSSGENVAGSVDNIKEENNGAQNK